MGSFQAPRLPPAVKTHIHQANWPMQSICVDVFFCLFLQGLTSLSPPDDQVRLLCSWVQ